MRDEIRDLAASNNRSMNAEIVHHLQTLLKERSGVEGAA